MIDLIKLNKEQEHLKLNKPVNQILPSVSVVVLAYNHENYIKRCLSSIISQKVSFNFELIIGEDQSNDGTRRICIDFANQYKSIVRLFLRKRENVYKINGHETGKFNSVASQIAARGKYIAICDGDDYWLDNFKLQKQFDFLENHNDCNYVFTKKKIMTKDNTIHSEMNIYFPQIFDLNYLLKRNFLPSTLTIMFKKDALPKTHPQIFWEAFNGDWVLLFILTHSSKIGFINEETAVYRQGVGIVSKTNVISQLKNGLKTAKALDKYTKYVYHYYLKNRYNNYGKLAIEYSKNKKSFKAIYFLFKRICNSILCNETSLFKNNLNAIKEVILSLR